VHPSIEDQLQSAVRGTQVPDESPENATVALRARTQLWGWDLAVTAHYGWDRLPQLRVDRDLLVMAEAAPRVAADPELLLNDPDLRETALRLQQRIAVGEELISAEYFRAWQFALELE